MVSCHNFLWLLESLSHLNSIAQLLNDPTKMPLKEYLVAGIVALILLTLTGSPTSVILRVPQDYPSIQEAINAANNGDTIVVSEGVYHESVWVNKTLTLIGENKNTTIIESWGLDLGSGIIVKANDVSIRGFTIRNCGFRDHEEWWPAPGIFVWSRFNGSTITDNIVVNSSSGIILESSSNSVISRNIVTNNVVGITLHGSGCHNNTIDSNTVMNNSGNGISIYCPIPMHPPRPEAGGNVIKNNIVVNHETGIRIRNSYENTVVRNLIADNRWVGIRLGGRRNIILENDIRSNGFDPTRDTVLPWFASGILLEGWGNNTIYHNNFINNVRQVKRLGSYNNTFDNGVEGNYWSDYAGEDLDAGGIGDAPYIIDQISQDHYPLMEPWTELSWWDIHGTLGVLVFVVSGGTATLILLYIKRFRPKLGQYSSLRARDQDILLVATEKPNRSRMYLIFGLLLILSEIAVFYTVDFPIYRSLCFHHIPEVFGFLFIGFWLAHRFSWWVVLLIYLASPFVTELLFKQGLTVDGILANALVSVTLVIGDWTERYRLRTPR